MREIGRGLAVLLIGVASLVASDSFALPVVPPSFSARVVATGLGHFPQSLDVTPDGTIYVAGSPGGVFRVTPSGQVSPLNGPFSGQELQGVIVRDDDDVFVSSLKSVYRLPPGASAFSVFSYNPSGFNASAGVGDLVLRGASLFIVGQDGSFPPLWTVDATTGAFEAFEVDIDDSFTALAYDPREDVLIGAGPWGLSEIDPETGSAKMFSFSGPGVPIKDKPPEPAERNHRTVTHIPFRWVGQAAVHPVTGDVYFTSGGDHEIMRATRDGKVSVFSPSGFDTWSSEASLGIAFDDAGENLYVTDRGTLYEISGDFVSISCSEAYGFSEFTTSGGGESDAVNDTLKVTFRGPVTTASGLWNRGRNRVTLCSGSAIEFEAKSTMGVASCTVNGASVGTQGVLAEGDILECTNQPEGKDIDRFTVHADGAN